VESGWSTGTELGLASRPSRLHFATRQQGQNLLILSQWRDPATNSENIEWARSTFMAMQPFFAKARYVNYLDQDDAEDITGPF